MSGPLVLFGMKVYHIIPAILSLLECGILLLPANKKTQIFMICLLIYKKLYFSILAIVNYEL